MLVCFKYFENIHVEINNYATNKVVRKLRKYGSDLLKSLCIFLAHILNFCIKNEIKQNSVAKKKTEKVGAGGGATGLFAPTCICPLYL